MIYKRQKKS